MSKETVPVRILLDDRKKLQVLANATGQGIGFWVQRAINNFLTDEAPIWMNAAQTAQTRRKKVTDKVSIPGLSQT